MIEIGKYNVSGFEMAVLGVRNSYDTRDKSDSGMRGNEYFIGEKDLELLKRLMKGTPERKFLRMIHVQVDIKAPVYWLAEMDTYKVGTVRNSSSVMHFKKNERLTVDDFSTDGASDHSLLWDCIVRDLNNIWEKYQDTKDIADFRAFRQMLPMGYMYFSTFDLNYETLVQIYVWRKHHRLSEWHTFCDWIEQLPYMKVLLEALNDRKDS